jgi:exopolysaccharide biosynthesis polyprenyl glycosylphosphotransferase
MPTLERIERTEQRPLRALRRRRGVQAIIANAVLWQLAADVVAIVVTMGVFYVLRLRESSFHPAVRSPEFFASVLVASVVYWVLVFWLTGLYRNWLVRSPFEEAYTVLKATAVGVAIPVLAILLDSGWFSYKLIFYALLLAVVVIALRSWVRHVQWRLRSQGMIVFPTLIVGDREGIASFLAQYDRASSSGYVIVAALVSDGATAEQIANVPIVGGRSDAARLFAEGQFDACIFAFASADADAVLELITAASEHGLQTMIVPDLYHVVMGSVRTLSLYGVPLIEISPHLLAPWQALVKRAVDIAVSATVLVVGMPVWLLIALAIKLDSPGPVLFTQYRVGKGNRPFKLYKFRSMTHGRWDGTWTQLNDPRVTRVGYFLRRTHIDEIPQLWNVLRGDMSLVGPRPEQVVLVEQFVRAVPYYNRRHIVRPGITGWNQVRCGRQELPDMIQEIRSRLRDDFYYIENMSLRLDFEIIVRTIGVMLRGHGIA